MMTLLDDLRLRMGDWIAGRKAAPPMITDTSEAAYMDLWGGQRAPSDDRLIQSYKNTAYACANLCAQGVASTPLRLFVTTGPKEAPPKCATRRISKATRRWVESKPGLGRKVVGSLELEEVAEHPILTLLDAVNTELDGFSLIELTQLYMEITGTAYWLYERTAGIITAIWILQSQLVTPVIEDDKLMGYDYGSGARKTRYSPDDVLPFHMPSLRDPYHDGWSPLQAAYENVHLQEQETAQAQALLENMARPDIVVSAKNDNGVLGAHEAERFKRKINREFQRTGVGKVMVLNEQFDVKTLTFSPREMERAIASGLTKANIANAFGVPMSILETKDVNRANAEAGLYQMAQYAILPRTRRFEQRLTQRFAVLFDPRLVLVFDDPVPPNNEFAQAKRESDLLSGVLKPNEAREEDGMEPVEGGDTPYMDANRVPLGTEPPPPPPPPVPPTEDADDEVDDDQDMGASMRILDAMTLHACKEIDNADAMYRLLGAGIEPHTASSWIAPVEIAPPTNCCTDKNPGPYTHDWHIKADRQGHGRDIPQGKALETELEAIFREQKKATLRQFKAILMGCTKAADFLVPSDASHIFDIDEWTVRMQGKVEPIWGTGFRAGVADATARLTERYGEGVVALDPFAASVVEAIDKGSFAFSEATNATTSLQLNRALDKVRQEIAEGILGANNTLPALTKRVAGVFDQAEAYRAERIARTEASRAIHLGQRLEAEQSGVVKGYRWLLSGDACPICQDIAASMPEIPLDGKFATNGTGVYAPIWSPPAHPNCMCTMVEILIDEEFTSGGSSGQF